jgi:hypothetical protein
MENKSIKYSETITKVELKLKTKKLILSYSHYNPLVILTTYYSFVNDKFTNINKAISSRFPNKLNKHVCKGAFI